ncbi:protein containing Prepilin-type cleavage/methylation [Candidatus Magnetobacterium bavaricum]|uniref:Protein containing Prepilin-type cleavage/methylation n=1 Tax=Candidatus Magnetobacterium bavaricum TaxID=29290 RepID=A0A0F3GN25_9BACT|nr:protein containing Prepilin-type cleavage/methylation [Candidatus Magnetobacterium bavaricum]
MEKGIIRISDKCSDKGFSLVEILVTMVIMGILAAIAIPMYLGGPPPRRAEAKTNLETIRLLLEQYFNDNGCYYRTGGPPTVCTNSALSGVANIQSFLPGFKPGNTQGLNFEYFITTTGATATAYIAGAVDKSVATTISAGATCAAGEMKVDNNNNRCGF